MPDSSGAHSYCGQGSGVQVVPAPCQMPEHKTGNVMLHEPSTASQQAAQASELQAVLSPRYVAPGGQSPGAVVVLIAHCPSPRQQAPGCGHGFVSQSVLSPWYVAPGAQSPGAVSVLIAQLPSSRQQAPGCGQEFGSQAVPLP